MRLDVRVEGNPTPTLTWMNNWNPVVASARIRIIEDGPYLRVSHLTIISLSFHYHFSP